MTASAGITSYSPGVWKVCRYATSATVLEDEQTFRAAQVSEFVPELSRSFFLATDVGDEVSAKRCRKALAAFLAPSRVDTFRHTIMQPIAGAVLDNIPTARLHLLNDYLRPYGRRVAYALAGLPEQAGPAAVAKLRLAADHSRTDRQSPVARALNRAVWDELRVLAERGALSPDGLPGFAQSHQLVSPGQAALLALPILEMAAFDLNTSLAAAAFRRIVNMGRSAYQDLSASETNLRALIWASAADMEELFVTRVVTGEAVVDDTVLQAGDRMIVDVHAANQDAAAQPPATHLAFGRGTHACIGREFALATAFAAVAAVLHRGWPQPADSDPLLVTIQGSPVA